MPSVLCTAASETPEIVPEGQATTWMNPPPTTFMDATCPDMVPGVLDGKERTDSLGNQNVE